MQFRGDWIINLTIAMLIFLGGLGFWVLADLRNRVRRRNRGHHLSLHSRIVLFVSGGLVLIGFAALLIFEWNNTLAGLPLDEKILAAFFQSVTTRTAGFNTLSVDALINSSLLLMILLMIIGASPGSCGGGIKTTTLAIIGAMMISRLRNRNQVQIHKRGIPESTISKAIGILFIAIVLLIAASMFLLISENPPSELIPERMLFIEVVFEAASALLDGVCTSM